MDARPTRPWPEAGDAGRDRPGAGRIRARLYEADGSDREVPADQLDACRPGGSQLLWVELDQASEEAVEGVARSLALPVELFQPEPARGPRVRTLGDAFRVDAVPVVALDGLDYRGNVLSIVAAGNCVVTFHEQPIPGLEALRDVTDGGSGVGRLEADSFVAALLDWLLATYFAAASDFERQVESLEVQILEGRRLECMAEMCRLRRAASRLRRMLAPHRRVFGTLSRPDFRPGQEGDGAAERHYLALDTRFERAMDMVEHARELVIGSFELFSSQTALQTNRAMGRLTFATVVLGILAVISGLMGMNFDASFFATRDTGFWFTLGGMVFTAVLALILGWWRRWL